MSSAEQWQVTIYRMSPSHGLLVHRSICKPNFNEALEFLESLKTEHDEYDKVELVKLIGFTKGLGEMTVGISEEILKEIEETGYYPEKELTL